MKASTSKILVKSGVMITLLLLQLIPRLAVSAAPEDANRPVVRQHMENGPVVVPETQPREVSPLAVGSINGHIYDTGSNLISGATVTAYDAGFNFVESVSTGTNGAYTLASLTYGLYYVGVQASGKGGVYYPSGYDNPRAQVLQVKSGSNPANIDFHLSPEATLSGSVLQQSDGTTPISGALIQVTPLAGGPTKTAQSAANGTFTIHGLATGFYIASASAATYEQEFAKEAVSADASEPIGVVQPNNTPGVDFTLSVPTQASASETNDLNQIYDANGGDSWNHKSGWKSSDNACTWYGVTCHDGNVAALELDGNNLSGGISLHLQFLSGLQVINFQDNHLTGSIVPPYLTSLYDLRVLNLSNNQLSGVISPLLAGLYELKVLMLNNNQLTGSIPSTFSSLTYLRTLQLSNNSLTGIIPTELGYIGMLRVVNLSNNQLNGSIPSRFGTLSTLTDLDLQNNLLSGTLPTELGNMTSMMRLYLNTNQLTGSIPAGLGNLAELRELNLSNNQLSGAIPTALASCTRLEKIQLDKNLLSGSIPPGFGALRNLQMLNLFQNQLTGAIPAPQSGGFANLERLDIFHNQLSGSIPSGLGSSANLYWLDLGSNQLSGSIPTTLTNLANLQLLYLDNNHLTGSIPTGLGGQSLLYFYLDGNNLTGAIPDSVGTLSPNLQYLYLENNQLSGHIPANLGSLVELKYLGLSNNHLTGAIPSALGSLTGLSTLRVDHNYLSGNIPTSLASMGGLVDPGAYLDGGDGLNMENNALTVKDYGDPLAIFLQIKDPDWSFTQMASVDVLPAAGAQMLSHDSRSQFNFLAGSVTTPTTMIYSPPFSPQHPLSVFTFAQTAFTLMAFDDSTGQPVTAFLQPVHLTMFYSDADVTGIDESRLKLYYWETTHSRWVDAATTCNNNPGYTRNLAANSLSLNVCHLTEFAVLEVGGTIYLPMARK